MLYVLLQEQSRIFLVPQQFGFFQSFLKIQFYNYSLLSKVVSPTNCIHDLRAVPKTSVDYICLFRFATGPNNCGGFLPTLCSIKGHILRLLDRVTFRIGVYNSKNSKRWGTQFILGALLGNTETTSELIVLCDTAYRHFGNKTPQI